MKLQNLPNAGLLLFSSTYSKNDSKLKYIFRVGTQVFTFSNYDHCATLIKCPMELDAQIIRGFDGKKVLSKYGATQFWRGNEYYVFEALNGEGNVVHTLEDFFKGFSFRSVKIDIQEYKKRFNGENLDLYENALDCKTMFKSLSSQLGRSYTVVWAGYSAFDKISWVRKTLKLFSIKPALSKANFCSVYAELGLQDGYAELKNKDEAVKMTPEEVRIKNIEFRMMSQAKPFIEYTSGKIRVVNNYYFE